MRQSAIAVRIRRLATTQTLRYPKLLNGIRRQFRYACAMRPAVGWLLLAPLFMWMIAEVYVPIVVPYKTATEAWLLSLVMTLLLTASLVLHTVAHLWTAQVFKAHMPTRLVIYMFGDAAQLWPTAPTPLREAIVAISGPATNGLLAGAAFLAWDLQLHPYLNTSMLFLAGVNVALAVLNLTPGFPLDGGRLARAIVWGMVRRPALGTRLGIWIGRGIPCLVAIWGLILMAQPARFGLVTGSCTVGVAILLGVALRHQGAMQNVDSTFTALRFRRIRWLSVVCILFALFSITISLLPLTQGVRVPGEALAVEQMIGVPSEYRHGGAGSFLLTTAIDQTPITVGQWVYAALQPSHDILPSEVIVPRGVTLQSAMRHSYRLLENSERVAVIVAQRIAGYDVAVNGVVVEIVAIEPESWAHGVLLPGDRLVRLDDQPIQSEDHLWQAFSAEQTAITRELEIQRGGQLVTLRIAVTPAMEADGPSMLGWNIQTVGYATESPFSVTVTPVKVVGGPSAGLMFALATYNMITPDDLTGGHIIAGTGTISLDGTVGPIGAIKQKVAAAEAAGAKYFLAPSANAAEARQVAKQITVFEIETIEQAIDLLRTLPPHAPAD